jgi:hypothetical protein
MLFFLLSFVCCEIDESNEQLSIDHESQCERKGTTITVTGKGSADCLPPRKDRGAIHKIVIKEGITRIPVGSCQDMKNLAEVSLPVGLLSIQESAFQQTALTNIQIPDTVSILGWFAFKFCGRLKTIQFPTNLDSIEPACFWQCKSLASIDLHSVRLVGMEAFEECNSLTSVFIPDSAISVEMRAFQNCASLLSIHFGEGLKLLGSDVCNNCRKLLSVFIGNSLEDIAGGAFEMCNALTNVSIGCSVKIISVSAFAQTAIRTISLPDSVTKIEGVAFYNCSKLHTIFLGPHVVEYWPEAFKYSNITKIRFRSVPDIPGAICGALINMRSVEIYIAGNFSGAICGHNVTRDPTLSPPPLRTGTASPRATRTLTASDSPFPTRTIRPPRTTLPASRSPLPTQSSSPSPRASPARSPTHSSHKRRNIVIGVSVGAGVLFIGLGVTVIFFCLRRRDDLNKDQLITIEGEGMIKYG